MYAVSEKYKETIYSGDAKHRLNISFLSNADTYCEKLTIKPRIIPNGNKNFTLNNFIAKEAELVLRSLPNVSVIQDQFTMSLTTSDRRETFFETVPLGVFNISDKPKTDKDKITIKLYDNAIKFDFNYDGRQFELTSDTEYKSGKRYYSYNDNSYTLLEEGKDYEVGDTISANTVYEVKSSWTKKDILNDICSKAGVNTKVTSFLGDNEALQIWDNSISARTYIAYIAEQAGAIATIDRDGDLIFVYLKNLQIERIPLWVVEKYELGKSYEIGRVVYEDGIRAFKYPLNEVENKDILFINASNPYISSQNQIEAIYDLVNGFKIDSLKTGKILGNPAIDPYDYIEIYNSYSQSEETIAKTLATYTMVYNGVLISTYDTQIGEESRTENMSLKDTNASTKRYVQSVIDPIQGSIDLMAGEIWGEDGSGQTNGLHFDMYGTTGTIENVKGDISTLKEDVNGLELNITKHGDNILMGTDLYDLSKWGIRIAYYLPSPTPPDSSLGFEYWYCSEDNENYINGTIYHYENNTWVATDLMRKDLWGEKDNNAEIEQTSDTMNNFISQRVLKLGYTRTEGYALDINETDLTFSCRLTNSVKNGIFYISLNQTSNNPNEEDDWNFVQNNTITINEQVELKKIEETFEINRNAKYIIIDFVVSLNEGQTIQDGDLIIGDIKLEYGKKATTWTNNYNEVYGKNYRMDDKGFKINKGDYELFLDEDELTGYYKETVMFQLNQYRTYSKIGAFEETDQNGLITKKISNGKYIRYIK